MSEFPQNNQDNKNNPVNLILFANVYAIVANFFYGLNINTLKYLMPKWIAPFSGVMVRAVFAGCVFWVIAKLTPASRDERVERKDFWVLSLMGVIGTFVYWLLYLSGLNETSPIDSSIISVTSPMWVLILAAVIFREQITVRKVMGIIVGFTGCVIVIFNQSPGAISAPRPILGDSLCAAAALIQAVNIIFQKRYLDKYHPLTILRITMTAAGAVSIPVVLLTTGFDAPVFDPRTFEWEPFLLMGYVLLFPTVLSFLLLQHAEKHLSVTIYSMYKYLVLIVASVLAIVLKQDSLSWYQPVAAALIFTGVFMVTSKKHLRFRRRRPVEG